MPKFIKVTRNDALGSYVNPLSEIDIHSEFDDIESNEPGISITFTVVEMSQEEYDNLPEFMGW